LCQNLLRQRPVPAETREQLRTLLKVASGGVVISMVHKFLTKQHPILSERCNKLVITDEAHLNQSGCPPKSA